jgi:hypothetical protein
VLLDQLSEPESLVEFAYQDQAAVGGDAGSLEIDLERDVEGELKGLLLLVPQRGNDPAEIRVFKIGN